MKTKFSVILALLIVLAMTAVANSQTTPRDTIYAVAIYVNELTAKDLSIRALRNNLMVEEGVDQVIVYPEKGIVLVTSKKDGRQINLFNLANRVTETREMSTNYTYTKMLVYALGHVVKLPTPLLTTAKLANNVSDRYVLQIGDTKFILAENSRLDSIVKFGYEQIEVSGIVTAFSDAVPIMVVADFKEPGAKESAFTPVLPPKEYIASVQIHVDGFGDPNLSQQGLEANLMTEEGVDKVTMDPKNETITIIPKSDNNPPVSLFNLAKRVNETRGQSSSFNVIRMTVEAIGHIENPTGEKENDSEQESRVQEIHKLRIGNTYFFLIENDALEEILNYGLDEADITGTVASYSHTVPVIAIDSYNTASGQLLPSIGPDPLDEIYGGFVKEKYTLKAAKHSQIDSVRFYMDNVLSPDFVSSVKADLSQEPGVGTVNADPNTALIEVIPKYDKPFDLYNIWHHVDMLQGYKIIKADVVASGEIVEASAGYQANLGHPQLNKEYKLIAGNFIDFDLTNNDNLKQILDSKIDLVTVVGTITNFKQRNPILDIRIYQKLEERPDWLK